MSKKNKDFKNLVFNLAKFRIFDQDPQKHSLCSIKHHSSQILKIVENSPEIDKIFFYKRNSLERDLCNVQIVDTILSHSKIESQAAILWDHVLPFAHAIYSFFDTPKIDPNAYDLNTFTDPRDKTSDSDIYLMNKAKLKTLNLLTTLILERGYDNYTGKELFETTASPLREVVEFYRKRFKMPELNFESIIQIARKQYFEKSSYPGSIDFMAQVVNSKIEQYSFVFNKASK